VRTENGGFREPERSVLSRVSICIGQARLRSMRWFTPTSRIAGFTSFCNIANRKGGGLIPQLSWLNASTALPDPVRWADGRQLPNYRHGHNPGKRLLGTNATSSLVAGNVFQGTAKPALWPTCGAFQPCGPIPDLLVLDTDHGIAAVRRVRFRCLLVGLKRQHGPSGVRDGGRYLPPPMDRLTQRPNRILIVVAFHKKRRLSRRDNRR
jgi:hypothetical protein